ncbi:hypothetical protein EDM80_12570 [bacterium]|nr:MAG: hypothetical protein EDM80_12570 [bacterium]RIK64448.1 MAG: hypothetical protein DCC64_04750 [Planctomycetota bacterium]
MATLYEFLARLFKTGEIVFERRPAPAPERNAHEIRYLEQEFERYALTVPGKAIRFDAAPALMAAEFIRQAAWFLVSRDEPDTEVARHVEMGPSPRTPGQHLSADLLLRFAPQLLKRARALAPDDVLVRQLESNLRRWPLSGVLAEISEAPVTAPDFAHDGLALLYAERLTLAFRPAWEPQGAGLELLQRLRAQRQAAPPAPQPGPGGAT